MHVFLFFVFYLQLLTQVLNIRSRTLLNRFIYSELLGLFSFDKMIN